MAVAALFATGGPARVIWQLERALIGPTPPPAPAASRDERWRQDLDYLAVNLARLHGNAFHSTPRAEFEAELRAARARVPQATDDQLVLEVMRLVALVGDGHTTTWSWLDRFGRLPLQVAWVGESWRVVAIEARHRSLLGAEVVAVGDTPVNDVATRLGAFTSADSEANHRARLARFLSAPDLLHATGLQPNRHVGRFTLRDEGGSVHTLTLPALTEMPELVRADDGLTFRQDPDVDHRVRFMEAEEAVYLRYRRCRDPEAFARVAAETSALLDAHPEARLIVDLRGNGGGDSRVLRPLLEALRARRAGARTFVLTDVGTYSSATMNALDLRELGATLVGEPTGDAVGGWGEVRAFTLPNSGLRIQVSTYRFGGSSEPVQPDVPVAPSVSAWLNGEDPVLEAALAR